MILCSIRIEAAALQVVMTEVVNSFNIPFPHRSPEAADARS